jgi:membrane associated rhomboid family serine protease
MLIPVSHEHQQARRWPWITIAIVLLNLVVFAFTWNADRRAREHLHRAVRDATAYYVDHPYLEPPPPLDKIVPLLLSDDRRVGPKIRKGREANVPADIRRAEQQQLDQLCAAVREAGPRYLRLYAYVPAENNWIALVTSQFLHGGFAHILFNLWFLWLVGVNMEDKWGRIVFPLFYLSAGVAAGLAHELYAPTSAVPLIGASGAVAGAMGAFLVGFATTRIRFVWLFWFRPFFFNARAYLMLPLWLVVQILEAIPAYGRGGGGVAHAAHVGGFVYGVVFALGMRLSRAEARIDQAIEDQGAVLQDPRIVRAAALVDAGQPREAMKLLDEVVRDTPGSIDVHLELLRAAKAAGDRPRQIAAFGRLISLYFQEDAGDTALSLYREAELEKLDGELPPGLKLRIARHLQKTGQLRSAAAELGKIHAPGITDLVTLQAAVAHAEVLTQTRQRSEALRLFAEARAFPGLTPEIEAQIDRGIQEAKALPDLEHGLDLDLG